MVRANMKHAILFGDGTLVNGQFDGVDTYEDWHLIPSSRPTIGMPGVESKFVTIPGMDGTLDLSEFLRSGRPAYGDRNGSFEFYVENEFDTDERDGEFWMTIYPRIVNEIHGRRFKMVLKEDDPDFYWEGRFTVDKFEAGDGAHSTVSISYQVGPFKRRIRKNSQHMVWDNFNFEKDYDYDPWNLNSVTGDQSYSIWGEGYPFQIEATGLSGTTSVTFNGETKTVEQGQTALVGRAVYGPNTLSVSGGTVKIDWRGGSL